MFQKWRRRERWADKGGSRATERNEFFVLKLTVRIPGTGV